MKFRTNCDMGSIKIFSNSMSVFFLNGVGDFPNVVDIRTRISRKPKLGYSASQPPKGEFLGHFTVRPGEEVHLSSYDCDDDPIYTFGIGRWFVHRTGDAKFQIEKVDEELAA